AAATQPLLQKIEKLETTTASLEAKLKALKDATSSQANKINKISSDSQHIKKKLATPTGPTQGGEDGPVNNPPATYAKAAALGIPQRQPPPSNMPPTAARGEKKNAPEDTNTPQPAITKPITVQDRRFFITRNTNTALNLTQHNNIKDTINACLREVS